MSETNDLVTSEIRFRRLIENSADAIVLLNSDGTVKYLNPAYAKMMGRNDLQRIGKESIEFVHPDDIKTYREVFGTVLKNAGLPVKFTIQNQHHDGVWHRLSCVANNLLEETGIESIVVNVHDNTDRWNAQEALRESESLYSDLVLNQIAGIYRIRIKKPDPGQDIWNRLTHEFVSDRFCDIFGIEKSEIKRLPSSIIHDTIHPDDRRNFFVANEEANLNLNPFAWEGRIIIDNGIKWVRFDSNPRKLDDESIRWTGVVIDITRQKLVEEKFKQNSDRLMKLNDCLSSLGSDYETNINRLTALCGNLLNATYALYNRVENGTLYSAGKWKVPEDYKARYLPDGHLCYDVIRNNKENAVAICHLQETNYAQSDPNVRAYHLQTYCGQVVRNEGLPVGSLDIVYNRDYHVSNEDRRIIGIIGSAIGNEDSRKLRSEALRASESKQKDLNATKDKFFSIIAHDLKGPFNGIIGLSEILKEEAGNLDASTIFEYAEMINSSALQSHRLLDNLLKWARQQEGKISFNPVPNVLHAVVSEVILLFIDTAERKNIELVNQVPAQLIVNADTDMLKTILRNLISNAMKFTNKNGKISIKTKQGEAEIGIVVSDTGVGISAENMNKLFKVDTALCTRGTENEKGTGLGLVLCKEFVEKHGGYISAKSKPGKGSKFKFTLPYNLNS